MALQALQGRVAGGFLADFRATFGGEVADEWAWHARMYADHRRGIYPPEDDKAEAIIYTCLGVATFGQGGLWPDLEEIKPLIARHRAEIQTFRCLGTPPSKLGFMFGKYDFIYRPWIGRAGEQVIFWRS
jgi:hypothetical protein